MHSQYINVEKIPEIGGVYCYIKTFQVKIFLSVFTDIRLSTMQNNAISVTPSTLLEDQTICANKNPLIALERRTPADNGKMIGKKYGCHFSSTGSY